MIKFTLKKIYGCHDASWKFRRNKQWEWGYAWSPEGMGEICYRFGFGPISLLWFEFD